MVATVPRARHRMASYHPSIYVFGEMRTLKTSDQARNKLICNHNELGYWEMWHYSHCDHCAGHIESQDGRPGSLGLGSERD